ncbi:TraX family protein [Variovorax sp. dw_954]|uniref:TraX family protein n=1 Tax=Variovorax sp. dw_954 TaxID=2720078 RepID=UPI001BD5965B|nr:TraX family protein [Variovorax sp. dw_954]
MTKALHGDVPRAAIGGRPAPLRVATGTLEALKWLGLVLMTLDHVNKYLLGEASAVLFDLGRMVMPVFGFVLMYNLARPGALAAGVHVRVMGRLLVFGALSTPMFVALVGWWPLNILFMLLLSTGITWLLECGGRVQTVLAVLTFMLVGAVVEFWWFGVLTCLGAWAYCRKPTGVRLALWAMSLASLWLINRNFAAMAALLLLLAATRIDLPLERRRWLFYGFYPVHLAAIWLALKLIS